MRVRAETPPHIVLPLLLQSFDEQRDSGFCSHNVSLFSHFLPGETPQLLFFQASVSIVVAADAFAPLVVCQFCATVQLGFFSSLTHFTLNQAVFSRSIKHLSSHRHSFASECESCASTLYVCLSRYTPTTSPLLLHFGLDESTES